MSKTNDEFELALKILEIIKKFYDSVIAIAVFMLLTLDTIMIGITPPSFIILYISLFCILIIDLSFNFDLLSKIFLLKRMMHEESKILVEKFFKSIFYLLIIAQIIINPPEVPIKFILNNLASIDFYFLITSLLITGLYFSLLTILKSIFLKQIEQTSMEN